MARLTGTIHPPGPSACAVPGCTGSPCFAEARGALALSTRGRDREPAGRLLRFRAKGRRPAASRERAHLFLACLFDRFGQVPAAALLEAARTRGIPRRTLLRAKAEMGLRSSRFRARTGRMVWSWVRPRGQECQIPAGRIAGNMAPLRNYAPGNDLRLPARPATPSVSQELYAPRTTRGRRRHGRTPGFWSAAAKLGGGLKALGCPRSTFRVLFNSPLGEGFVAGLVEHALESGLRIGWVFQEAREEWRRMWAASGGRLRAPWERGRRGRRS